MEDASLVSRWNRMVPDTPILRIGNIKDEAANRKASFAKGVQLTSNIDTQHNPEIRRPVWHTDSTFRQNSPIGSVFHCRQATPKGAETLFADSGRHTPASMQKPRHALMRWKLSVRWHITIRRSAPILRDIHSSTKRSERQIRRTECRLFLSIQ